MRAVSIHAPTRGATAIKLQYFFQGMFQSTHPHGVRQASNRPFASLGRYVSIHAPTRGATMASCQCGSLRCQYVSIHAPTRGATPAGCPKVVPGAVSIHAPTRGATPQEPQVGAVTMFQSTHPHGARRVPYPTTTTSSRFQSTHPHGVRQKEEAEKRQLSLVSIHAPTRGATPDERHTINFF